MTDPLEALEAFLCQDFGTYDRLAPDADPGLLATAFRTAYGLAAADLFEDRSVADIIGFVARVRERYDRTGDRLDPRTAELLLRAAASGDDSLAAGLDRYAVSAAQVVLLGAMVYEANWDEPQLDAFLAETRSLMAV